MTPLVKMSQIIVAVVVFNSVYSAQSAHADGCIFGKGGKYIPEKEQRAFIEWKDGQEQLFVATRIEKYAGPSLWIVPVPAAPKSVKAEPVETFPHVERTKSVIEPAQRMLRDFITWTLIADTGGFLVGVAALGQSASQTFSSVGSTIGGVTVHQRVEKLGMVVEVITAESTEALDGYLADKKLDVRAANIKALDPYMKEKYTLICGWVAEGKTEMPARAVRIDFPTPTVFFPLRPTRVYETDIDTRVFVRGWFQPTAGTQLAGLKCSYLEGQVVQAGLETMADRSKFLFSSYNLPYEPVTQVQLSHSPRDWNQDLNLEKGAPAAISFAAKINQNGAPLFLVSLLLSLALSTFLPNAAFPVGNRRSTDWIWAAGVGMFLMGSIFLAGFMFYAWFRSRQPAESRKPLSKVAKVSLWIGGISIAILLLMGFADLRHISMNHPAFGMIAFAALVAVSVALPVALLSAIYSVAGVKTWLLLIFSALHFAAVLVVFTGLIKWLGMYA